MNKHLSDLLVVARGYAAHRGLSLSHVSKLSTGGGKVLDSIEDGSDMTTGRLISVMRWFSDNWPAELAWPEGVERPDLNSCVGGAEAARRSHKPEVEGSSPSPATSSVAPSPGRASVADVSSLTEPGGADLPATGSFDREAV